MLQQARVEMNPEFLSSCHDPDLRKPCWSRKGVASLRGEKGHQQHCIEQFQHITFIKFRVCVHTSVFHVCACVFHVCAGVHAGIRVYV